MKVRIQSKNGAKVININRRKAIRENCLNCSGWNTQEVKDCQHTDCPLYPYRLGRGPQNAKARAKAIRDYCLWCMNGSASEVSKCVTRDCPLFPYRQYKVDTSVEICPAMSKLGHIRMSPAPKMTEAVG
jgi:hypothetical protein